MNRRPGFRFGLGLTLAILAAGRGEAGPITFLTALPVAKSQVVIRGQYLLIRASDDPTSADRELTVNAVPLAVAVGLTPRLALFGIVPILNKSIGINTATGRVTRAATGLGDVVAFGRYTVYAVDRAEFTFRIAPFGKRSGMRGSPPPRLNGLPSEIEDDPRGPKEGLTRTTLPWLEGG